MFESTVKRLLARHGVSSTYTVVTHGVYDVNTSQVSNTSVNYTVKIYMKHLRVNQFNYPNLIGKDTGLFYIAASDITFTPKPQDKIIYNSKTYKVDSVQSHAAEGSILLYRIIGVV